MSEQVGSDAKFCIVLGQRASWPEMLARTRETEELGFDGLFLVDHFYGLFDVNDPTHEAYWVRHDHAAKADELLAKIDEIAEIFWETKKAA